MFRAKETNGQWTKAWELFVHRSNRDFLQQAEKPTETSSSSGLEVWVAFQRTIKDDPSILTKAHPALSRDTFEPCWFLNPSYGSNCVADFIGDEQDILFELQHCEEDKPFAILQHTKFGPNPMFLITVVKRFRKEDVLGCGYTENDEGEFIAVEEDDELPSETEFEGETERELLEGLTAEDLTAEEG